MLEFRNMHDPCLGFNSSGLMQHKKGSGTLADDKCVDLKESLRDRCDHGALCDFLVGLLRFQSNFKVLWGEMH